jgi:hypothetical protein
MIGYLLQNEIPRWAVMWGLVTIIYGVAKLATWACCSPTAAPLWKHVGYLVAWPGMDVDAFLNERCTSKATLGEWCFAVCKTVGGVFLVLIVCPLLARAGVPPFAVGWAGMLGIVFALHFGLFHLISCAWRALDVNAVPIMNWPIVARDLTDFWSRRWNLAFRDLANRFVFRPFIPRVGPAGALLASFVASGLIHDLAISVPAGGGYGLPTLYFLLQGIAILVQRSRHGFALHLAGGVRGWLFTAAVLVLPCPLLFHSWFIYRVIIPFLQAVSL